MMMLEVCKKKNISKIKKYMKYNQKEARMGESKVDIEAEEKKQEIILDTTEIVAPQDTYKDIQKYSLYDGVATNFAAIILSILIITGIQIWIQKIFLSNKNSYRALTQFVTTMLGLIVGGYMINLIVASPHAKILSEQESMMIVSFVKDICLMVFAYYFGTQSKEEPSDKGIN
jgi:hypothetical protein